MIFIPQNMRERGERKMKERVIVKEREKFREKL